MIAFSVARVLVNEERFLRIFSHHRTSSAAMTEKVMNIQRSEMECFSSILEGEHSCQPRNLIHTAYLKKNERYRIASSHPLLVCLNVSVFSHEKASPCRQHEPSTESTRSD